MKTRFILLALLPAAHTVVRAQVTISIYTPEEADRAEIIDRVLFTARYQAGWVGDTLHPEKLILKASDSRRHFTFVCTGIRQNRDNQPLRYPGKTYEPVSRKALQKIYARYAADPLGYLALTAPHIQVTITGEDGKPARPKNTPFNPIEKAEK